MATVSIQFVRRLPRGKCKEHDVKFYILASVISFLLLIRCPASRLLIRFSLKEICNTRINEWFSSQLVDLIQIPKQKKLIIIKIEISPRAKKEISI